MYVAACCAPSLLPPTVLTLRQFWLLGYEFPTTLMLFTVDTLYILTTAKKGGHTATGHMCEDAR